MSTQTSTFPSSFSPSSRCVISCHCGAARQTVELKIQHNGNGSGTNRGSDGLVLGDETGTQPRSDPNLEITLCHCYTCRHTTGQMFASWAQVGAPEIPDAENKSLQKYQVVQTYAAQSSGQQDRRGETAEREGGRQERNEHEGSAVYYFCGTCGCHLFRRISTRLRFMNLDSKRTMRSEYGQDIEEKKEYRWEVATGVIAEDSLIPAAIEVGQPPCHQLTGIQWRHEKVSETTDGGLSVWLDHGQDNPAIGRSQEVEMKAIGTETDSRKASSSHNDNPGEVSHLRQQEEAKSGTGTTLRATCHCENISFSIIRPSSDPASSTAPRSNFPDLMYPYISTPKSAISNPDDVKWWLRVPSTLPQEEEGDREEGKVKVPPGTKYLAGTCACRSCRLTSGFEVQSWAFITRGNIFMDLPLPVEGNLGSHVSLPSGGQEQGGGGRRTAVPLEFPPSPASSHLHEVGIGESKKSNNEESERLKRWPLKSYESSPGVVREFCPVCGATVFWHDKWRPDLIDVSVGLLRFSGDGNMNSGEEKTCRHGGSGEDDVHGARHESWLEWWRGRVSFAEDVGLDRVGGCSVWGRALVGELEMGLRSKGGEESIRGERVNETSNAEEDSTYL